jgi:hemerythrin-like metal-binding protein
MYIQWNESLSVHVKELDDQHKKLFDMINNFYAELEKDHSTVPIKHIITDMKKYALLHFNTEEKFMTLNGFPKLENHKGRHQNFIKKVQDLEEKLDKKYPVLPGDIVKFLKEWILLHIQIEDKTYSNYFIQNGVIKN